MKAELLDESTVQLFTYGAASALLKVDIAGIACWTLRGPLTAKVVACARHDFAAYLERRSVLAVVVRLEQAAILLPITDIVTCRLADTPPVLRSIPAALVVSPAHMESLKQYAQAMAEHGIMRRVFTDPAQALGWATAKGLALLPFPPELPCFQETQ